VASQVNGGREAVRDGALGILVDPNDSKDIKRGILKALERPKDTVPDGLEYFSYTNFEQRAHHLIDMGPDYGSQITTASAWPTGGLPSSI
jgi:phosphatidyl-myo-inositol dimannoside synthase